MNYINYFQAGGQTQATGEENAQIMFAVLDALGIDQKTAIAKLDQIAQSGDEETISAIGEAIQIIIDTQQNHTEQTQQAAQFLQETLGSQMFKQGGKLNSLVERFKKGGVSCKCGCKSKVRKGESGYSAPKVLRNPETLVDIKPELPTIGIPSWETYRRSDKNFNNVPREFVESYGTLPSARVQNVPYEKPINPNNNIVSSYKPINDLSQYGLYENSRMSNVIPNEFIESYGALPYSNNRWDSRKKINGIVEQRNGGLIEKGQSGLTTDYDDPDLNFRYGEYSKPISPSSPDNYLLSQRPSNISSEEIVFIEEPEEDVELDLNNFNFKNAFRIARKSGMKEFNWRGKRYNTNLASTPKQSKRKSITIKSAIEPTVATAEAPISTEPVVKKPAVEPVKQLVHKGFLPSATVNYMNWLLNQPRVRRNEKGSKIESARRGNNLGE